MNKKTRIFIDSYIWMIISFLIVLDSTNDIKNGEGWINYIFIFIGAILFFVHSGRRGKTLE